MLLFISVHEVLFCHLTILVHVFRGLNLIFHWKAEPWKLTHMSVEYRKKNEAVNL